RRAPERVAERGPRRPRLAEYLLLHDAAGLLLQDLPPAAVGVEDGRAVHPLEGRSRQGPEGRGPRAARGPQPARRRPRDRRRPGGPGGGGRGRDGGRLDDRPGGTRRGRERRRRAGGGGGGG